MQELARAAEGVRAANVAHFKNALALLKVRNGLYIRACSYLTYPMSYSLYLLPQ
jgi:hypothetical protein